MKIISVFFIALVLLGCKYEGTQQTSATGRAGELLVVIENKHYQDLAGTALREVFQANIPTMLTREPFFDVVQIPPESFTKLFETHRHIFIADIDQKHQAATIEKSVDHWSNPQMVIRVKAPDQESFVKVMSERGKDLVQDYINTEHRRFISAYKRMINNDASTVIKEKFGFSLAVPDGYFVAIQGENFAWLRQTGSRTDLELGVLVATTSYTNPEIDFAPQNIKARRDSITRIYIHGVTDGSYMTTYSEVTHPEVQFLANEINFNGMYAVEARSLWTMEKEFMGGPFVNYTLVDPNTNKLVMLDGWVFYPNQNKRDYMRQVEALIRSLNFNPEK